MTLIRNRLTAYLDEQEVKYHLIHHGLDYNAKQTATDTTTSQQEFAKTVVLKVDESYAFAVVTAAEHVDLNKVRNALGVGHVELAHEKEMLNVFPDCEVGAEPPFGNLYDVPVFVSHGLTKDETITFNAGTHVEAIRVAYADFERLVKPQVLDMVIEQDDAAIGYRPV